MFNVVLFEPEIPQNTGNIARTCAATGTRLHLVHPLGFSISEKAVRHAGLDYWKDVEIFEYKDVNSFLKTHLSSSLYFFSTKGKKKYTDANFRESNDIYLIFGKESRGIEEDILIQYPERTLRIPMLGETRSLNLSNSVAIAVYEALRQNDFDTLKVSGALHRLKWRE